MLENVPKFQFQLVSPEAILFTGEASMVVLPATTGALGVLFNHAPTVVTLDKGVIDVYHNGERKERLFVGGGFANITESSCVVMADEAISVEDIHPSQLEERRQEIQTEIERAEEEEERRALRRDLSITKAKIDIFKQLMQG